MKKMTAAILTAALLMSVVPLAGCGNENNTSVEKSDQTSQEISITSAQDSSDESSDVVTDISTQNSNEELTSEKLAKINSFIEQYKGTPDFSVQSETIKASEITKGKNITLIPDNTSKSFSALVSGQFKDAAKSAGFSKYTAADSDGTPAYFEKALEDSISGSDIVILFGDINKDNIATSIERTQANGVRVLSAGNVGKGDNDHYVDYTIPIDYQLCGALMADWAISSKKGKVNALVVNNSDSTLSSAVYLGFADEFKENVTTGYCTVVSGSNVEIGNSFSTKVRKAIDDDPNINYVIVLDEDMINDAVSGVYQSSNSKIPVIATGGSKEALSDCENGKIEMLVAQSYEYTAYAMVDYAIRVLGGKDLPEDQSVPVRVLTAESIKKDLREKAFSGMDGFYEVCFGSSFVGGYATLWGK